GLAAAFGYFASLVMHQFGLIVPWQLCSIVGLAVVSFLGYRSIDLSARALAILMVAEILLLFVFDVAVVIRNGLAALPADVWLPHNIFTLDIGAGIAFTVVCFVGFESAALYGEEASDPRKSVPRATYISLGLIATFYLLTVWCMIGAAGPAAIAKTARAQGGALMFGLMHDYAGDWFVAVCSVFLVTSLFAAWLALHNAASRYLFAVARDRLLPARLATFHPRYHSPHVASVFESVLAIVVVGGLAMLGMDPYVGIGASVIGAGTIGIIALQTLAAFAIGAYFGRRPGVRLTRTIAASIGGGVGLAAALVLVILNYPRITGSDNALVDGVPLMLLVVALGGLAYALYLRAKQPQRYAEIGSTTLRADTTRSRPDIAYRRRYCIVGAGPAGLIVARALLLEGVPFDYFEKHHDV
ncbi:MAG: amino acid permease, partial [Candidatus Eremiobacteraeota bacterium]|nr:amino acid permease [Candidatus Eremiobacteraeota bacterium]